MNDWTEQGQVWFYQVSDDDGTTIEQDHKDVAHIILGHELIYATHHMQGRTNDTYNGYYYYRKSSGEGEFQRSIEFGNEEFDTVGFKYFVTIYDDNGILTAVNILEANKYVLTENKLRLEQGLQQRVAY